MRKNFRRVLTMLQERGYKSVIITSSVKKEVLFRTPKTHIDHMMSPWPRVDRVSLQMNENLNQLISITKLCENM